MSDASTREKIIATAERLFAEQGATVSSRQISEAAGQANNSAVGYHFGSRTDLVLAVVQHHESRIALRRAELVGALPASASLRDWLACVVRPLTEHLDAAGRQSRYAQFLAQVTTDPVLRQRMQDETLGTATMAVIARGMARLLRRLPPRVFLERSDMMRLLIIHTCAERERALQVRAPTPYATWDEAAQGMVDALCGLWAAPISTAKRKRR